MMNNSSVDKKVKERINELFAGVGSSQALFELKEELSTNIKEKVADFQSRGMDEQQSLQEAMISLGDLSELVEEMRQLGQNQAKQKVYSTRAAQISTIGIVVGVLLILFGGLVCTMLFFQTSETISAVGPLIFVVLGGAITTYSVLTRETKKCYGMNKIRATIYAAAVGTGLFGFFVSIMTYAGMGKIYTAIAPFMVFFMISVGVILYLILTEVDRKKENS
ncbi:hypothetical protein SAMN05444392_11452 [Seinonella peptonophila]|uniref:Uncharacterized protein n=1 Tax=Seinonella peptonophila TaxID=112248 RepID=A0A1M5AJS2_9BACL|nr:permease prefix domain 1-containing protein [Seinonella peptonophila]SHF30550.1 hypothetical protein SAMN05444392_11452 [Seinonella peptonophila]